MNGTPAETPTSSKGNGLATLRYLVSLVVAGSLLSIALSTRLDGIVAPLAWPVSVGGAIIIGLPIVFFMRRRKWRRAYHVIAAGAVLGMLLGLGALPSLTGFLFTVAAGAGGAVIAWFVLKLQTLPLRFAPTRAVPLAATGAALALLGLGYAATIGAAFLVYGPPPSPESRKIVAAFEIPLPSAHDSDQLLSLLRQEATAEGLHVDASNKEALEELALAIPEASATINATVRRGKKDNRLEASVTDSSHVGFAWIIFFRGEESQLANRFRRRAMTRISRQWPGTQALPIMPTGAIPLRTDLEVTPNGYKVKPSAAARYAALPGRSSMTPEGVSVR